MLFVTCVQLHRQSHFTNDLLFLKVGWVRPKRGYLPCASILRIPQIIWVWRATVEWYWQGKTEELGEKPVPVPLCPPQIPNGLNRARTRASAVRGRRLTTWATARPLRMITFWREFVKWVPRAHSYEWVLLSNDRKMTKKILNQYYHLIRNIKPTETDYYICHKKLIEIRPVNNDGKINIISTIYYQLFFYFLCRKVVGNIYCL
jgi:hypothetical protein